MQLKSGTHSGRLANKAKTDMVVLVVAWCRRIVRIVGWVDRGMD